MDHDDHERLFSLSQDMLCVAGFDGYFKLLNPAWEKTLGWTPEELKSKPFIEFVHPDDRAKTREEASSLADGQNTMSFQNRYQCKDGSYKWLSWRSTPSPKENRIYAIARDITERKKVEQIKNEIIGMTNHELRTPLVAVQLALDMLHSGDFGALSPQSLHIVEVAGENSTRMLRMINDFLDLEKIESGKMEFELNPLLLSPFIDGAVRDLQTYADRFTVRYIVRRPMADVSVMADSDRMTQVMANLLSNAAKFSPAGGSVEIAVERRPQGIVRISVADHGAGIPEEFRGQIFQKFSQAPGPGSSRKGTGLGLSISKAIVEMLGGSIGFETALNAGTTFFIDLPELATS